MEQTNKLPVTDKTVEKLLRRITNLENVVDAQKDELREAREAARIAALKAERRKDEAEHLAVENERYLAVIEALASALDARNR